MIERMFKWIVCARQPLQVDELREGIAFTLEDEAWSREKIPTEFTRLVRACGNLVVIDEETQTVQLAHFTVQQYLLQPLASRFHFTIEGANNMAGEVCVAYLSFSNFEMQITKFKENANTDLAALAKVAGHGHLLSSDNPGSTIIRVWNSLWTVDTLPLELDMTHLLPRPKPKPAALASFALLSYIATHWLWHTIYFQSNPGLDASDNLRLQRRDKLFTNLILHRQMAFDFRPWEAFNTLNDEASMITLLGWALMANHPYLIINALYGASILRDFNQEWTTAFHFDQAWRWLVTEDTDMDDKISAFMLDKLELFSEDSKTLEQPAHGWLYSKLLYACRRGHLEVIQACTFLTRPPYYLTDHMLVEAATYGNLPVVEYFCSQFPMSCEFRVVWNSSSLNAVERAVLAGHLEVVKYLLKNGFKIRNLFVEYDAYFDLIRMAIIDGDLNRLECLLLLQDPDYGRKNPFWRTKMSSATTAAVEKGRGDMVKSMIRHGTDITVPDSRRFTPLVVAVSMGDLATAEMLAKLGPEVVGNGLSHPNAVVSLSSASGQIFLTPTPLYMACYHGNYAMARMLIDCGAAIDFTSPICSFRTQLYGNGNYGDYLELPGAEIDQMVDRFVPSSLWTIQYDAFYLHELGGAKSVDRRFWDVNKFSRWQSPITAAIVNCHYDIATVLLQAGASTPESFSQAPVIMKHSVLSTSAFLNSSSQPIFPSRLRGDLVRNI
jgi:hypothetical protein